MAAELRTPVDKIAGLPLPIAPAPREFVFSYPNTTDEHHGWHPASDPLFTTPEGIALRNSWLQTVPIELHNTGKKAYHNFYHGPKLPANKADIFSRCILACAGYIPERVIDLSSGVPAEMDMTDEHAEFFHEPHENLPYGYQTLGHRREPIREFFRLFMDENGLGPKVRKKAENILLSDCSDERHNLGRLLLIKLAERVPDNLREKIPFAERAALLSVQEEPQAGQRAA